MTNKNINIKTLKIGDTLRLVLKQTLGDFANVTGVTSSLKATTEMGVVPPTSDAILHSLTVTPDEENSSWYIVLSAANSATLNEGEYVVDVKIATGGEVDHTDTLFVRAKNSVT